MTNWEAGNSFGRQVRRDAILTAMEAQIATWETERLNALKNASNEPGYNSYQSHAEQLAYYINATEFWLDKLKTDFS